MMVAIRGAPAAPSGYRDRDMLNVCLLGYYRGRRRRWGLTGTVFGPPGRRLGLQGFAIANSYVVDLERPIPAGRTRRSRHTLQSLDGMRTFGSRPTDGPSPDADALGDGSISADRPGRPTDETRRATRCRVAPSLWIRTLVLLNSDPLSRGACPTTSGAEVSASASTRFPQTSLAQGSSSDVDQIGLSSVRRGQRPPSHVQRDRQTGKDRQVNMKLDPFDATHTQGQHRPFVLQAAELSFHRPTLAVEGTPPVRDGGTCSATKRGE